MYTVIQRVYQNAVSNTVLRFVWFTPMCVDGIVHLVYEAPWDLPICVQGLRGHPYGNVSQQASQMRIAVVLKYRLCQSSPLGVVYSNMHYRNCIPIVRGSTGSPKLCTKAVWTPVRQRMSASCTDPYSGFTKLRFASEFSALFGLLPCSLSPSYTYCTRHHRISQFMYKGCAGTHTAT